jgi:hypothetical protein
MLSSNGLGLCEVLAPSSALKPSVDGVVQLSLLEKVKIPEHLVAVLAGVSGCNPIRRGLGTIGNSVLDMAGTDLKVRSVVPREFFERIPIGSTDQALVAMADEAYGYGLRQVVEENMVDGEALHVVTSRLSTRRRFHAASRTL